MAARRNAASEPIEGRHIDSQNPLVLFSLNVALGDAYICEGNATGDPSDTSNATGRHSEAKMIFKSQCQTTKSEGV